MIKYYMVKLLTVPKIYNMDVNVCLFPWFINFLIKRLPGGVTKYESMWNKQLTEELQKPIIRKFEKWKVHLSFIDNIRGADLADIQLFSKQI